MPLKTATPSSMVPATRPAVVSTIGLVCMLRHDRGAAEARAARTRSGQEREAQCRMASMAERVTMWFNPNCSKCRTADSILQEKGVDYDQVRYLETAPSLDELEQVLRMVGSDDPRAIMRTGEDVYKELGLGDTGVDRDRLLAAM